MSDPSVCPHCGGTGKGNPLPPSRYGPGPCLACKGTGKRPEPKPDEQPKRDAAWLKRAADRIAEHERLALDGWL